MNDKANAYARLEIVAAIMYELFITPENASFIKAMLLSIGTNIIPIDTLAFSVYITISERIDGIAEIIPSLS